MVRFRRLVYSLIFALCIFFLSLGLKIVPCQTAPKIPNPEYSWTFCTLNPDVHVENLLEKKYFGITEKLTTSYILIIALMLIFSFAVLSVVLRKKQ